MGTRGKEGKYQCSAVPSLAGAAAWPGEASSRWSAWELWHIWGGVLRQPWDQAGPALSFALIVWLSPG